MPYPNHLLQLPTLYPPSNVISPSVYVPPLMLETKFRTHTSNIINLPNLPTMRGMYLEMSSIQAEGKGSQESN
jgi:hypothetical protein